MSQASIDSVQSWLSFELEQRGIDAVVYARHILNLFLSSHFTTDLHLAKKEASIFARLPPGPSKTKPKPKSRKRSNSSPFDEIALKKEMATECLRSAVDDVIAARRDADIESLIEDLYIKLSSLNLLTTDSSSSSDERRVGKPKEKHHESYHDAFPQLFAMPENATKVNNLPDSVWNGQPIFKKQVEEEKNGLTKDQSIQPKVVKLEQKSKWPNNKSSPQQLKLNGRSKKYNSPRRYNRRRLHPFDSFKKSPRSARPRNFNQHRKKERTEHDKENASEPKFSHTFPRKKNKTGNKVFKPNPNSQLRKSFFDNVGTTVKLGHLVGDNVLNSDTFANGRRHDGDVENASSCEKDISHLYSMGLPDFYKNTKADETPSSKWFRDPQSGCLEFEPAYKNRNSSDTSPSSVESWLWCPSPSLWDDSDESSSQSRFETIYKPPARSHSDSQACQLWKDYEAIFRDIVQDDAVRNLSCTYSDHKFAVVDSNNNESFSNLDCTEESALVDQVGAQDTQSDPWQTDDHQVFVDDGESICGLDGWFSISPLISSGQSRKEIWLKNSKALKKEEQQSILFFHNNLVPDGNGQLTDHERFASLIHLDEFLCDLSFQIRECCNLHWLWGWDMFDDFSQTSYPFPVPSGVPLKDSHLHVSRLQEIYSNTFGTSYEVGDCNGLAESDDVFSANLYAPTDDDVASLPWALVLEKSDPITFLPDDARPPNHGVTTSTTSSLEDCITENQAWKSSLRIGNMWQSISGIRRVNVLYSEKQVEPDGSASVPPSSCTHFRPIHENELDISDVSAGPGLLNDVSSESVDCLASSELVEGSYPSTKKQHTSCDGCSDCDMKIRGLEQDLDNLLGDATPKDTVKYDSDCFQAKFLKTGEDKSMQTSFEEHIRRIESDICHSLSIRPPKANSR